MKASTLGAIGLIQASLVSETEMAERRPDSDLDEGYKIGALSYLNEPVTKEAE